MTATSTEARLVDTSGLALANSLEGATQEWQLS
jgi:hypothetical protein